MRMGKEVFSGCWEGRKGLHLALSMDYVPPLKHLLTLLT